MSNNQCKSTAQEHLSRSSKFYLGCGSSSMGIKPPFTLKSESVSQQISQRPDIPWQTDKKCNYYIVDSINLFSLTKTPSIISVIHCAGDKIEANQQSIPNMAIIGTQFVQPIRPARKPAQNGEDFSIFIIGCSKSVKNYTFLLGKTNFNNISQINYSKNVLL